MNFEHRCTIPARPDALWDFLMEVPRMALCVPGVERVERRDDDRYEGRMRIRVGPIGLALDGVMTITERDADTRRAAVAADANDRRVGGGLHATARMRLIDAGPDTTDLLIEAEARLLGKLGEFGQPVIRKKADTMMAEFARNVASHFAEERHATE